jgi:hypothetical protein
MDPTTLVLRWAHILAAIVAMGGLVFARYGLLPALAEVEESTRDRIHDAIRRRWLPWVIGAGEWMRQTSYHALFGAKFLLAMVVFYFASALVGRGEGTQWVRNDRAKWLSVTLGLALAIVLVSGWMRQLHTGPDVAEADGGVRIEEIDGGVRIDIRQD